MKGKDYNSPHENTREEWKEKTTIRLILIHGFPEVVTILTGRHLTTASATESSGRYLTQAISAGTG